MKRTISLSVFLIIILISVTTAADRKYAVVKLEGSVNPVIAEFISDSIEKASKEGADFIVIQMDTPGGLVDAMRDIIKAIFASDIPVVVYTYPKGAQAASAGGFIMIASHIAVMAPGTEIGAMHPVSPMLDFMQKDKKGAPAGVMEKKVLNDTIAYGRSLAQERKRNVRWTENAIRSAVSSTNKEALKLNIIDFIADDMDDLIKKLDGRRVMIKNKTVVIHTDSIRMVEYVMDWKQDLLNTFADPQIIFLLFIIAVAGIGIEFKNPGMIVPGVIGAISLFIFLMAIQVIPINVLGLVLIILAVVLFIMELYIVSYGLLTIGGIIAFVLGSMILFDSPLPGGHIPMSSIIVTVLVLLAFIFLVVRAVVNVHRGRVTTGIEGMIGETGNAISDFTASRGKIFVRGEIWSAVSDDEIQKDDEVEVNAVEGMICRVRKVNRV